MVEIEELKRKLAPLEDCILGAYLYGSHATGPTTPRSDIDLCLVAGPDNDPREVLQEAYRRTPLGQPPYDVRIFEELPLYMKAQVLEDGNLILSRDEPALSEYVRRWSKVWGHQAHRNRTTKEDLERIFAART